MNDILKQRLVGALILVALGVVFWPIIFVEPGERTLHAQGHIPPPPALDTSPIEPPEQPESLAAPEWQPVGEEADSDLSEPETELDLADPDPAAEAVADAPASAPTTRTEAPATPALDADGVPVAWILQVASVSNPAKADELRDSLIAMREKAYVKKVERGDKDLYRVYVGPNVERAQLERIQAGIDTRFKVKSLIVRYSP